MNPPNARSQQFFENQLGMRSHTKSICMIWLVCIWLTIIELYIWKKAIDLSIFFVWKCAWWGDAENGVDGKEIQIFHFNGIKLVKMHSDGKLIYLAINMY